MTLTAGSPGAGAALVALHGRGGSAQDMLALAGELGVGGLRVLAPQAAANTWYPYRFIEPLQRNEPWLSRSLEQVGAVIAQLQSDGIQAAQIALLGFSQGVCLALEYAARHPMRYGCVVAFSGSLIGDRVDAATYNGSLDGTPVFLGCSDVDSHIPLDRVKTSARILELLGATVTERIYPGPGMGHVINADEVENARRMLQRLALTSPPAGTRSP